MTNPIHHNREEFTPAAPAYSRRSRLSFALLLAIVALGMVTSAWCGEPCQAQRRDHDRALARAVQAKDVLEQYENGPLAPLVPDENNKELQQLKDNYEATLADVIRTGDDIDRCLKRKSCKKWKGGWRCTVAGTYEECCLDKNTAP